MTLIEAVKEVIWLGGLLDELGVDQKQISIYYDRKIQCSMFVQSILVFVIILCGRLLVKGESYFKRLGLARIPQIC